MTQGEVGGQQKMTDDNDSSFRGRGFTYFYKNEGIKQYFSKKLLFTDIFNYQGHNNWTNKYSKRNKGTKFFKIDLEFEQKYSFINYVIFKGGGGE